MTIDRGHTRRHQIRIVGLTLLLSTLLVATGGAVVLHTTILRTDNSTRLLVCWVSNVGTKSVNVAAALTDSRGRPVNAPTNSCRDKGGVLAPGESCTLGETGNLELRCSVEASSSQVRAALHAVDINGVTRIVVPATK